MSARFELESFLPFQLNRASESVSLRFAAQYKPQFKMTRPEWRVLAALGSRGRMTATQVTAHAMMHKTKVSRAVLALERRRWLVRREDPSDRRVEQLQLTPLGIKSYGQLAELALNYEQTLLEELGPRALEALRRGLKAVESAMAD
jgi:DNA-binding MarR family transcriptional regulator